MVKNKTNHDKVNTALKMVKIILVVLGSILSSVLLAALIYAGYTIITGLSQYIL